jgi:PPM family protein phosphatase
MHSSGKNIRLRSGARTSTGQVRENNEDNIHLWVQDDCVLAIVADGMGGAAAGEEASRLAVEAIQDGLVVPDNPILKTIEAMADDNVAAKMRDIIREANNDIMRRAANDPELRGMGTTVTLAFIRDMHAIVAHVGDSRAYLVSKRDNTIMQITADHSFVEALVAAGHITQEQAEDHPMKNVLYRALGQTEDVDVDVYHTRLRGGDRVVLCSDGLTRHVKASEITELALASDDPEIISQKLIDLANERGGEDNVSVVVVVLDGDMVSTDEMAQVALIDDDTIVLKETLTKRLNLDDTIRLREWPDRQFFTNSQPSTDGQSADTSAVPSTASTDATLPKRPAAADTTAGSTDDTLPKRPADTSSGPSANPPPVPSTLPESTPPADTTAKPSVPASEDKVSEPPADTPAPSSDSPAEVPDDTLIKRPDVPADSEGHDKLAPPQ